MSRLGPSIGALGLSLLATAAPGAHAATRSYDVVVVGATPAGVSAAVCAARLGHRVALFEYQRHVGGMSASGLGKSDVITRGAIGGLFLEFVDRVRQHYVDTYGEESLQVQLSRDGYFYEPSVAERVFGEMLAAEPGIELILNHRLEEAARRDRRVVAVRLAHRDTGAVTEARAGVFIDATYEGDLAAYAGAAYRLGRESREEFGELLAGVLYMDHRTRSFLPGTTGLGDDRLPAYTFRLCLSTDPANRVPVPRPPDYDRTRYLTYLEDLERGRIESVLRAFTFAPIPNGKTDVNMRPVPHGYPFAEENAGYVEADWETRERIVERIRNITLGLLWFVQNDPEVPADDRAEARRYGLAADEFVDNDHFPWQLYVREARRVVGLYTLSERDLVLAPESRRAPVHHDAIAAGEFPIDAMPTRKHEPGHPDALEGYILMMRRLTSPYHIPYRTIVPRDVDGLLVPVALSATHVAFSSIRLEPTWMCIGQAAALAAHLSLSEGTQPRDVHLPRLQRMLLDRGQVLTYFEDAEDLGPASAAMQYFGTKGFFSDYHARADAAASRGLAVEWLSRALETAGVRLRVEGEAPFGWSDLRPGDDLFREAAALAFLGLLERPEDGARFEPGRAATHGDLVGWLDAAGALLGLWPHETGEVGADEVLRRNGLGPRTWSDAGDQSLDRPLTRGELCRALFALLGEAGY